MREKELKKKEKELMKQRRALLEELQDLLRDDDTDEKITSLLDRMNAVHTEMVKEKQAYLQSLKDFLSIQQVGKLVLFEQRFAEELRRLLSKHGSRRPPPRR
ncbi:MAG: hypothetical protein C0600_02630 [Ignavibacteria bacterium]|nr:MAG: hypothetical protein C0600_02630 [Ignavibacteria bacterium]